MIKNIPIRQLTEPQNHLQPFKGFKIRRVEDITGGKDLVHDLHRHAFFFVLAIREGDGSHEIDFVDYRVTGRSVFFLRPGQVHRLELKAGCSGYLLEFSPEFYHPAGEDAKRRLARASRKNHCIAEQGHFEGLESLLYMITDEFVSRNEGFADVICAALDIFFVRFLRQGSSIEGPAKGENYMQERYEEFLELLDSDIAGAKQIGHYTGRMNLSAYQLNEITKSLVGKTASEMITEHILLEARRYLLATSKQVKEIAELLGYEDISYFIRFFRKQTGYSPMSFRQNFR